MVRVHAALAARASPRRRSPRRTCAPTSCTPKARPPAPARRLDGRGTGQADAATPAMPARPGPGSRLPRGSSRSRGDSHATVLQPAESEPATLGAAGRRHPARADRGRQPGRRVHLRPVGLGVRAARRGRLRAARLRRRLVDLPRRPAGRPLEPEPGAAGAHPGHVQRARAGDGPDAVRGRPPRRRRHRRRAAADADVRLGPGRAWSSSRPAPRSGTWPAPARTARPTAGRSPPTCPRRTSSGCSPRARCRSRSCSAPASTTSRTRASMQSLRQAGQNQEMVQFTQGVYEARELALIADAGRGHAGPVVRHRRRDRRGQQPRLGRARDRVPGHRHRHPPAAATSTGCRRPRPSRPSPSASTTKPPGAAHQRRPRRPAPAAAAPTVQLVRHSGAGGRLRPPGAARCCRISSADSTEPRPAGSPRR